MVKDVVENRKRSERRKHVLTHGKLKTRSSLQQKNDIRNRNCIIADSLEILRRIRKVSILFFKAASLLYL